MFKRHFLLSVCHTTRSPRTKEENLEDYFFVTQEEFEQGVVMVRFHSALDCLAPFIFPLMCQLLDFPSFFDLFFFSLLSYSIFILLSFICRASSFRLASQRETGTESRERPWKMWPARDLLQCFIWTYRFEILFKLHWRQSTLIIFNVNHVNYF